MLISLSLGGCKLWRAQTRPPGSSPAKSQFDDVPNQELTWILHPYERQMAKKRSFSPSNVKQKKDDYHGSCRYVRTSPDIASKGIKSVNVELTLEQALQLSLAIQSGMLALNRYNRATTKGREMGLCLSLKTEAATISVIETKVKTPKK